MVVYDSIENPMNFLGKNGRFSHSRFSDLSQSEKSESDACAPGFEYVSLKMT